MGVRFRILMVEYFPADAERVLRELKRAGIRCAAQRVETVEAYRRELEDFQPHVIFSDVAVPGFDGMEALAIARQAYPDIPFIFISGTPGEEYAVRALKNGATDYLLKSNVVRIPDAMERAIKDTGERSVREALEREVQEHEKRYQLFQSNPHPMWVYDLVTLRFLVVNDAAVARYGFSRQEFLAMTIRDIRPESEVVRVLERAAKPLPRMSKPEVWQHRTRSGELIDVEIASHDLVMEGSRARLLVAYDVTARKRAEEALRTSETRLQAIIENEPECVKIVGHDGEVLEMNPAGLAMLQARSLAEVQQKTLIEFVVPEHRSAFGDLHKRVMNGERGTLEFEVVGLRGAHLWLETCAAPLRDPAGLVQQFLGITRDVTERKRAQQQLAESQAKYRHIVEQASDGITICDADGYFLMVNARGCELLGYTQSELLGVSGKVTYFEEEWDAHSRRMAQVRAGETMRFERMVKRKDGSAFPAEISFKMLNNGMLQALFHDITERRNQEHKFQRLSRIHAVLSGINSAIVRIHDRQALFEEACRIAVEHGGFRMAWIGLVDQSRNRIEPKAWAGHDDGFLDGVARLTLDATRFGMSRSAQAVLTGKPVVSNDIASDPQTVFKKATLGRGYRSGAAFPLMIGGEAVGIFSLFGPEKDFFDQEELKLLQELAGDIAFALDYLEKADKLNYLAYYDALTGLPNRSLFSERLSQQLHTRAGSPELVAVALIDVERLRMVNDTLSRQAGDELLRQIARRLESNANATRCSNPARVTADFFGVIIRGARDAGELAHLLEAGMRSCFGVPFFINGQELRIVARAGISAYPTDGSTAEALLHNAEAALRKAKQTKERFVFYAPEMNARVAEFLELETKLRKAIEFEQFVLHYQPKFNVASGKITGLEALIRWNDPDTGLVPPLQFIPILEETGMIFEVGRWALRQAVGDQQLWLAAGLPALRVAVNVSAQQLRDPHFVQDVQRALASQEGLKLALELEITESILMEDIERNIERLKTLRDLGVTIAIDDFGTGYSSLNYLARLPMDTVKIDRSFVAGMTQSQESRTIVSTIISLAHSLGLKVVAEGVETQDQLNSLRLLNCDEVQGFLLGRPVASDDVESFHNP